MEILTPEGGSACQPDQPGRWGWLGAGDINACFGLLLDNLADLVLAVSLLSQVFQFPTEFALRYMVPGTALGVLFGDLVFTWMAIRLGRRTGRSDITAMPLGLDTPSTFGMVFFVLGPAYQAALATGLSEHAAATRAWHIGIGALLFSGLFKLACAVASGWVRRLVPRAGLLGSLAAVALVLISFLPLVDILETPLVGVVSLVIILATLVARIELPWKIPGALGALLIGAGLFYFLQGVGLMPPHAGSHVAAAWLPSEWLTAWQGGWIADLGATLPYLPVVIPFALATVVGGIDCTESAATVGDEYDTGQIIAVEGLATILAACCGGVIQTVPYIGHPAYKAMGGRAGYTLATALIVGSAGIIGYFGFLFAWLPKAAVFPILIFIGLEITAQSFLATPRKHYPAVALACVPALAYLVMIFADNLLGQTGKSLNDLSPTLAASLQTLRILSGGFIVTSVLWAAMLAALIDRRLKRAAAWLAAAGVGSLFGVIHSPLPGSPLLLPWNLPELPSVAMQQTPLHMAAAYGLAALVLLVWSFGPVVQAEAK